MNLMEIIASPLTQTGRTGPFLRLVLAECASYGMPAQVIATLDDIAAMLGYYAPLPSGPAAALSGPGTTWQTNRHQPTHDRFVDVERLATKQRALIAFGGGPDDHRVGTAEIVNAMVNLHKPQMPPEYYEIWTWASTDVLVKIMGSRPDDIRKEKGWPVVLDADVLKPGGRLFPTYVEMATSIRRTAIGMEAGRPSSPREVLLPMAKALYEAGEEHLKAAETSGDAAYLQRVRDGQATILGMFPVLAAAVAPTTLARTDTTPKRETA